MDILFWHDRGIDGKFWPAYWPEPPAPRPDYCGMRYHADNARDGTAWGSDRIPCKKPGETPGTYFYPSANQMLVATSIAHGDDPQYNTSEIYVYENIGSSTVGVQLSFITSREHVSHVQDCRVIGDEEHPEGSGIQSRYQGLFPEQDYGPGYLILSVDDIVRATGRNLDARGSEGPLRITGLEIVAKFDLRNYHVPFRWPIRTWNPFGFASASEWECTVRFEVLREQFTPVQWFYNGTTPVALQNGLRIVAMGSGRIGYFSLVELFEKLLLGFAAFGLAQVVLDLGWYYLFSEADSIAAHAFARVEMKQGRVRGLPFRSPKSGSYRRSSSAESLQLPLSGKME